MKDSMQLSRLGFFLELSSVIRGWRLKLRVLLIEFQVFLQILEGKIRSVRERKNENEKM